ncbi:semaphorin-4D isoform X1 [Oncorhynchus keta]|uniref:semaphorin-4D isoform X1 n=2 Tax=Oncorhynchus keta TaxID=8018 RepID=UPI00227AEFA6|nr:semaphorin-4D isoform X1 [Oncorhynchus keta]XP_052314458.1 semaphorin-4D isoform X1 [Oncorhynchus keta]XP_052314459.1 semaphorin-4D isoform X1 [Oncorhynchus keta]XP_052314460.1 semaphorin-4D isoform X1 [Oncorhynchus keta]XP_052314461.1 semaphorin-4D isoform X1 [Oncorhynchus keta]XP_052314462.1 semaphorin-4D isoform X1 [Oncorhynchus keta]XP_052314463.1 semaphorin-4D isoform X1 [Oncorhynchus keta]XP_052314464.1 semaphorin-4D isoform X1 [Oncorhynchus keta]XP_052314465.1 semaphorin-4D isofor
MNQYSLVEAMTDKGNFTVPKLLPESNMVFGVLGVFLGLLLEVSTHGPHSIPRTSWKHEELKLVEFSEPGIFNYSTLLLSEDKDVLYVGAREAIFELRMTNVSIKNNKVQWKVPENHMTMCIVKGKSKETDCLNYIRVLQVLDDKRLYVCGTHAFQPVCHYLSLKDFSLEGPAEDGRGKCSFDPSQSFTTVMVDGELYSGTSYNFLGSEPIISRYSLSQSLLRTEYSTSWLNEPSFVFADVIREGKNSADGEDDKIYYFFTEVSVEYEFFGKLLIPRIARVCKGDLGGQRTLQKKWTSFLKAKLVCSMPELNFVFNVVNDVFILKTADWRETVIYGVFTSQWGNVGLSAVCAYDMMSVENVFSKGKYMQKATVEQSHTKWVRYNGITPTPRPGACINNHHRLQNISSSLHLPDKTLQFVKDHPLLEDPVLPIGNGPKLITKDVSYTQIAVERVQALDNNVYDVIFTGTDKGLLHKSVVYDGLVHTVEEIQLLHKSEPIKTLLLSSQGTRSLYAGSDSGVVQSPTAFCDKYPSCSDCILTRDPYCAWDPDSSTCVNIFHTQGLTHRNLIQSLNGDADKCPSVPGLSVENYQRVTVKPGSSAELPCLVQSNLAVVVWKQNSSTMTEASKFHLMGETGLLIYSVAPEDHGLYECWSLEWAPVAGKNFSRLLAGYVLDLDVPRRPSPRGHPPQTASTLSSAHPHHQSTAATEGNNGNTVRPLPLTSAPPSSTALTSPPPTHSASSSLTTPPSSSNTARLQPKLLPPSSSALPLPETRDPATEYLQHDNSSTFLFLFLLFFLLFLAALVYNCYMQYLPGRVRLRAALLGSQKKPQPEYLACEAGLMEPVTVDKLDVKDQIRLTQNGVQLRALRDTGYETEPECSNGKVPSRSYGGEDSPSKEKPFDVDCDSQPIEYADADQEASPY